MKELKQPQLDEVLAQGTVMELTVHRAPNKHWYFTVLLDDVCDEDGPEQFTMVTQRGQLRTWADPRNLFEFLNARNLNTGIFKIHEGIGSHESTENHLEERTNNNS